MHSFVQKNALFCTRCDNSYSEENKYNSGSYKRFAELTKVNRWGMILIVCSR